jgi:hypothetical protein
VCSSPVSRLPSPFSLPSDKQGMKHALIVALFSLCTVLPAMADNGAPLPSGAPVPATAVDAFLSTHGGLLVRDFYEVGSVAGDGRVDVYAVVFSEPGNERVQVRGLRIEVTGAGKPAPSASRYVDADELDGLSRGLKYMLDVAAQWKGREKQEYTEIDYSTKDRLRLGFYQRRKSQGAFAAAGDVQAFLDARELERLKAILDDGQRMLKGK